VAEGLENQKTSLVNDHVLGGSLVLQKGVSNYEPKDNFTSRRSPLQRPKMGHIKRLPLLCYLLVRLVLLALAIGSESVRWGKNSQGCCFLNQRRGSLAVVLEQHQDQSPPC
jgi:hypothetical protein